MNNKSKDKYLHFNVKSSFFDAQHISYEDIINDLNEINDRFWEKIGKMKFIPKKGFYKCLFHLNEFDLNLSYKDKDTRLEYFVKLFI